MRLMLAFCRSRLYSRALRWLRLCRNMIRRLRYFDISKLKLPYQTLKNHEPFRALHPIVVEMSVG